jgi:hypothetical protein
LLRISGRGCGLTLTAIAAGSAATGILGTRETRSNKAAAPSDIHCDCIGDKVNDRTFVLKLRALPGVDAIKALRHALKRLLRSYGLKCVDLREECDQQPQDQAND